MTAVSLRGSSEGTKSNFRAKRGWGCWCSGYWDQLFRLVWKNRRFGASSGGLLMGYLWVGVGGVARCVGGIAPVTPDLGRCRVGFRCPSTGKKSARTRGFLGHIWVCNL